MREVDLLLLFVILVHREVDDPAEAERALLDELELFGDARASEACELGRIGFFASGKKQPVVGTNAERMGERIHLLGPMVLGDWAAPFATLACRVAETCETFGARPFVHVVEEFAAKAGGVWSGHGADHAGAFDNLGEQAEARTAELLADIVDQKRISEIRLVCSVL